MKSIIDIWKFPADKNYFDYQLSMIDFIRIEKLTEDAVSSYSELFHSIGDFTDLRSSELKIKIDLQNPAISSSGKTVRMFFKASENKNSKYLVIKTRIGNFRPDATHIYKFGIIEPTELTADLTIFEDNYDVEFKLKDLTQELIEFYKLQNVVALVPNSRITFDEYMQYYFLYHARFKVNNQLNIVNKVGFMPQVSTWLQYELFQHGVSINIWDTFKALAMELGFSYRLIYQGLKYQNKPKFALAIFWRSIGLQRSAPITRWSSYKEGVTPSYANKWVFLGNRHDIHWLPGGLYLTYIRGFIMNKNKIYNYDTSGTGFAFIVDMSGKPLSIHYSENPLEDIRVQWEDITNMTGQLYDVRALTPKIKAGSVSYSRIFVQDWTMGALGYNDWGSDVILAKTAIPEYKFLLSGLKSTVLADVDYNEDSDLQMLNGVQLGHSDYWIEQFDVREKEYSATIHGVEI